MTTQIPDMYFFRGLAHFDFFKSDILPWLSADW